MTRQRLEKGKILMTRYFAAGLATVLLCVAGSAWANTVSGVAGSCTVDTSNGGTGYWGDASSAQGANDAVYAEVGLPAHGGSTSDYLECSNFGFSIPANATINGITLTVWRMTDADTFTDTEIRILKGGVVQNVQNKANSSTWPVNVEGTQQYGSSSDLWGVTWTAADINDVGLGVALSVTTSVTDPADPHNANVDAFQITVDFTVPSPKAVPVLGSPSSPAFVLTALLLVVAGMLLVRWRALHFV